MGWAMLSYINIRAIKESYLVFVNGSMLRSAKTPKDKLSSSSPPSLQPDHTA